MDYDIDGRLLRLRMRTRRKGPGGCMIGDLMVVAETQAGTVEDAAALVTRGREMAVMVSMAANAAIAPLEVELVYETTPGEEEREFFQRFVPDDEVSYADRAIPMDATCALLTALATHEQRNRIIRAISQYSEALQRWEFGSELLVVAHLWMGVEAIKTASWRREINRRAITKETLAAEWGFKEEGSLHVEEYLNRCARLRLVFKNDARHHRIAKNVSDSFEHGFANGGDLFKPARDALVPTAAYLREAIIDLTGVADEHRAVMLGNKYKDPKGPCGLEQYFRAVLVGKADKLAADGQEHPYCEWEIAVDAKRNEDGSHTYSHTPKMTVRIADGIQLRPVRNEVFARGTFKPLSAAEQEETELP